MSATIKDVANLAGVSFKTVSRVINREPSVGEALQTRVWEAIKTLDYQPNVSARQLRGSGAFIAFIYDNPNSHYVIDMQHGLLDTCQEEGFELLIHPLDATAPDVMADMDRLVRNGHIAGLVLTPPFSENEALVGKLRERDMAFVRIRSGRDSPEQDHTSVMVDDFTAALDITRYLVELGHQRIAFLGGELEHGSSLERQAGYLAALSDAGIAEDVSLILPGEYNFDSGSQRTQQLLRLERPPTAVFGANDEIAAGALFAARINHIAVPQALSIAGFEDSPFSRQTWPKLTTVHQPNTEIARAAAANLIHGIRMARFGKSNLDEPETLFRPAVVVRDSTCPVMS